MAIRTYDPKLTLVVLGNLQLQGFAEDKFIQVERLVDTFDDPVVGASGETARVQSNNRSGKVTFTTLASSPTNDLLSALHQLDEQTGAGVGSFQLTDNNGTTLVHSVNAWVKRYPNVNRAKTLAEVEWIISCDDMDVFVGGLVLP